MANIISLGDVYVALCSSKPTLYKAVVSLILSSGMSPSNISKLTLNDFLFACNDYFNDDEEKSIINLLRKNPWSIIPSWKLKSDNIITFNTPEATFYLFLYLKEKRMDDLKNLNNPLFKSGNNNFLTSSKISAYVTEFNTVINSFNGCNEKNFKSKNLIATFEKICDKHMCAGINNENNILKLFQGKLTSKSKFYRYAVKNPHKIKKFYEWLVPFLTARLFNVETKTKIRNSYLSDDKIEIIIHDFYNTELKEDLNLDFAQEQLLCQFAQDFVKHNEFCNDYGYLNKLFKKARIKLKVHNYTLIKRFGFYVDKNSNPEVYAKKLEGDIYNMGIYDLIEISRKDFYKLLIYHVVKYKYYNRLMSEFEAKKIIKNVLYELIDNNY